MVRMVVWDPWHIGWARWVVSEVASGMPLLHEIRSGNGDTLQSASHGQKSLHYKVQNPPVPCLGFGVPEPAGGTGDHMPLRLTPGKPHYTNARE